MDQENFSHLDKDGSANMVDISEQHLLLQFAKAQAN